MADRIRFGEKGTKIVEYTGERPCEFYGAVTRQVYVFTAQRPRKVVDLRDLPELAAQAGRENLVDQKGALVAEPKPKQTTARKPATDEEVDDE